MAKIAEAGEELNVIGEKEHMQAQLPAFSIRNADPAAVMNAVNNLLVPRALTVTPAGEGVYSLRGLGTFSGQNEFRSFQLAPNLAFQSVDDIVAAIRLAWQLDPAHKADALKLKYHAPTNILLAYGPHEAIIITTQIILNSLKGAPGREEKGGLSPKPTASLPLEKQTERED